MARNALIALFFLLAGGGYAVAGDGLATDRIMTSDGELAITFVGHGSLYITFRGKVLHVDPYGNLADYSKLPDADVILITHDHRDHLDSAAIGEIRKDGTVVVLNEASAPKVSGGLPMGNGSSRTVSGVTIEAVPAYNLVHMRSPGNPFHPKGVGNGYVLTFADTRVYVAGDTENIPEMADLKGIDVAFLPMNLPYTMTPEMAAEAARSFRPRILYPYHFGETDPAALAKLLADQDIEVRIRDMR
ncbi:MAG: MBL fold metallo-hydrolase [bacterium]|nr:MAG: MBL fold metallo-hydrolase [bacterium]